MNTAELLTKFGNWLLTRYPEGKTIAEVSDADLRNFQDETGIEVYADGEIP